MGPDTHCGLCENVVKYPHKIWQFDTVMRNEEWSHNINYILASLHPASLYCVYLFVCRHSPCRSVQTGFSFAAYPHCSTKL